MNIKKTLMNAGEPVINPITKAVLKNHYQRNLSLAEPGSFQKVVVLAPHMDDETIGLGGTIRRHVESGAEVHCIFSTDGASSESDLPKEELSGCGSSKWRRLIPFLTWNRFIIWICRMVM